jgi:hypothetical protein
MIVVRHRIMDYRYLALILFLNASGKAGTKAIAEPPATPQTTLADEYADRLTVSRSFRGRTRF